MSVHSALTGEVRMLKQRKAELAGMLDARLAQAHRSGRQDLMPNERAMLGEVRDVERRIKHAESELARAGTGPPVGQRSQARGGSRPTNTAGQLAPLYFGNKELRRRHERYRNGAIRFGAHYRTNPTCAQPSRYRLDIRPVHHGWLSGIREPVGIRATDVRVRGYLVTRRTKETADSPAVEVTIPMRVLPSWRICHHGRAYEAGEVVELPLLQAAEMSAWGSIERVRNLTPDEHTEFLLQLLQAAGAAINIDRAWYELRADPTDADFNPGGSLIDDELFNPDRFHPELPEYPYGEYDPVADFDDGIDTNNPQDWLQGPDFETDDCYRDDEGNLIGHDQGPTAEIIADALQLGDVRIVPELRAFAPDEETVPEFEARSARAFDDKRNGYPTHSSCASFNRYMARESARRRPRL